jgi:hypothetical protein
VLLEESKCLMASRRAPGLPVGNKTSLHIIKLWNSASAYNRVVEL